MSAKRKLTPFLATVRTLCRERLIEEKWLLAPSLRVGRQWLDSLTLSGTAVINCRVCTLAGMAMRFAGPVMNDRGLSYCNDKAQLFLVDSILRSLSRDSSSYFWELRRGLSLSRRVCAMLEALELAGIGPDDITRDHFESEAKHADVVLVFKAYRRLLSQTKQVDYSDVLKIAAQAAGGSPPVTTAELPFFIVPTELDVCELERRLLESLPRDRVLHAAGDADEFDLTDRRDDHEQERVSRALTALMARDPRPSFNFFTASGEYNEIKEVFRRCVGEDIPLDDVEIVYTDASSYVPVIYETVLAVCPQPVFDWSQLPVTFAEGISVRYSRPGRALRAWIEWIGSNYPQAGLAHLVEDGLLNVGGDYYEDSHFLRLGRLLRSLVIVNGRDRYLPILGQSLERARGKAANSHSVGGHADQEDNRSAEALADWQALYHLMECLCKVSAPQDQLPPTELIDNVRAFVLELCRSINEMDNYARLALLEELDGLHELLNGASFSITLDILEWVRNMPDTLRILGSGPRPGCVHASHIMNGGCSGRRHLFIVGLDDDRFPGAPAIDPLLLDDERQKISDRLATSSKRREQNLRAFIRLLARQTGEVCLSYSNTDLSDDASLSPSSVFQAAWNHFHPNRTEACSDKRTEVLASVGFVPAPEKQVCTENEWWVQRILGQKPQDKERLFQKFFPNLRRGFVSSKARASNVFTEYDGYIGDRGGAFDPTAPGGPVLSVQKLETFAKCPLSYFFKYVLAAGPPEEPGMATAEWLSAMETGSRLHEVFKTFIEELMAQGRLPLVERDHGRLHSILLQCVDKSKEDHPPPSLSAFHRQVRLLERAADIFLVEEELASHSSIPRFVEASIGLRKSGVLTVLDQEAPEVLEIEPGVLIRIQARVDRIDESMDGAAKGFIVWDYKTGGTYRYRGKDLFHQGRNLQHAIYTAIVAALLRRRLHPDARVYKFGYYFPSMKGRGVRIVSVEDCVSRGNEIVRALCRMMSRGCFPATNDAKEDCQFCEYAEVCGDVETAARQSHSKIANQSNQMLADFRWIRDIS